MRNSAKFIQYFQFYHSSIYRQFHSPHRKFADLPHFHISYILQLDIHIIYIFENKLRNEASNTGQRMDENQGTVNTNLGDNRGGYAHLTVTPVVPWHINFGSLGKAGIGQGREQL